MLLITLAALITTVWRERYFYIASLFVGTVSKCNNCTTAQRDRHQFLYFSIVIFTILVQPSYQSSSLLNIWTVTETCNALSPFSWYKGYGLKWTFFWNKGIVLRLVMQAISKPDIQCEVTYLRTSVVLFILSNSKQAINASFVGI